MKRRYSLAFLAGLLIFLALSVSVISWDMVDFTVNYTAGQRLLISETLYRSQDGHYQFKYPPFAALLYLPLSLLPLAWAKALWAVLIIAVSAGSFVLSSRLADAASPKPGWTWLAFVPVLVLLRFFLRELQLGQINAILTFVLILMILLLMPAAKPGSHSREAASGLLWGFSVALKPYALIFLPYLVLRGKVRALASGAGFLVAAFLAPSVFYGFSGNILVHREWVSALSESTPLLLGSQDNVSLMGFLTKWTGHPDWALRLWAAGLLLLAFFVLAVILKGRRLARPQVLECGLLLLLIPLISPLGWDYTFLSSVLAVSLLWRNFFQLRRAGRVLLAGTCLVIGFSIYDILGRSLYAQFMSVATLTVAFLILAGLVGRLRFRAAC